MLELRCECRAFPWENGVNHKLVVFFSVFAPDIQKKLIHVGTRHRRPRSKMDSYERRSLKCVHLLAWTFLWFKPTHNTWIYLGRIHQKFSTCIWLVQWSLNIKDVQIILRNMNEWAEYKMSSWNYLKVLPVILPVNNKILKKLRPLGEKTRYILPSPKISI
jgi:hypothetical protein